MTFARVASVLAILTRLCCGQDFSHVQIERIATGFKFLEGPVWSGDGYLLFNDIPAEKIYKVLPPQPEQQGKAGVWRENSGGSSGLTFDKEGRLYTCEDHARRVTRTDKKSRIEVLADHWDGKRLNAPNDIVVRHDGHVYFTDPAFGHNLDTRELDFYGVFHLTPKGELKLVAKWATRPNGVAFSPNGNILYVADSDAHTVHAFDVDRAGEAIHDRIFISDVPGSPDGLRVDEKGDLYVAGSGISVYSSAGKLIITIPIGETPSNCAFGDEDLRSLYITARSSLYRIRLDVKGSVQY